MTVGNERGEEREHEPRERAPWVCGDSASRSVSFTHLIILYDMLIIVLAGGGSERAGTHKVKVLRYPWVSLSLYEFQIWLLRWSVSGITCQWRESFISGPRAFALWAHQTSKGSLPYGVPPSGSGSEVNLHVACAAASEGAGSGSYGAIILFLLVSHRATTIVQNIRLWEARWHLASS